MAEGSLKAYRRELDYSYAPGLYPALEAVKKQPSWVRRVLIHSKLLDQEGRRTLLQACEKHGIRVEEATRMLSRLGKDNMYAAAVFEKPQTDLVSGSRHLVLCQPAVMGNLGTILRSALGFGFEDVAVIRPAADPWDPQVVRASMGALFSLRLKEFDRFEAYRKAHPEHHLYPFMLTGAVPLKTAAASQKTPYALVMGNEGSGLPEGFAGLGTPVRIPHGRTIDSLNLSVAASIGMYAFAQEDNQRL